MAYEFYVTVEAAKPGRLAGETTRETHQGKLAGIGFSYVAAQDDAELDNAELEDVALTFRGIEIENVDARTSASDTWGMR